MVTGKNYIGNVLSSIGKKTFQTFNPETNSLNKTIFTEASIEELNTAVQLATEAFKVYQNISGKKKAQFLNEIANQIEALGDSLLQTYCAETGLPQGRAIGERTRTIFQLKSFAQLVAKGDWVNAIIDRADEQRKPIPKVDLRKMNIPIGPVVVFGASNFPLAYSTAGGDTAAALAAGCPVIVKSHPMHAGTGELVAGAVIKAAEITEMPNGIFSNLNSSGIEIGELLVKHPEVKAVGFTGSVQGGRALFNLASQRPEPIPVFAEMGSINPVVLLPHAAKTNYKKWANNYAQSIMLGSGQFCTNPGLILGLKSEFLTSFMQSLSEEIVKIDPSCMLNPAIIGNFEKKKAAMFQQSGINSVAENTKLLKTNYGKQAVATVDGETFLNNTLLHQEVFGPFSLIVQCDNQDQLIKILNKLEGQLTGTILASETDLTDYKKSIEALQNRVGRIIFNGVPTGVEVCPAMQHGGPYPASTDSRFTAVGTESIKRWVRPFSFQNWPNQFLPDALKNENPLHILRKIDGEMTSKSI